MGKSADAFRTISEVAEWLETPAHVLRFWESKFSQVKPVKRAGGRRYYRPADMLLLGGIKKLLHDDGMTIKGVQKLLRDQGVKHVSDMAPALDDGIHDEAAILLDTVNHSQSDGAKVLDFTRDPRQPPTPAPSSTDLSDEPREPELFKTSEPAPSAPASQTEPMGSAAAGDTRDENADTSENRFGDADSAAPQSTPADASAEDDRAATEDVPTFRHRDTIDATDKDTSLSPTHETIERQIEQPTEETDAAPSSDVTSQLVVKPQLIDLPDDPPDTIDAGRGVLSGICSLPVPSNTKAAQELEQIAHRLRTLIKPEH